MVLHLAHHKSYHPYNAANIARVKADEAAAELEEASQSERASLADSEARIEALRKKAGLKHQNKRKRNDDESEKAMDQQLEGRGWASGSGGKAGEAESRATVVRPEDQEAEPSHELNGHINFWADYESGRKLPGQSKKLEAENSSKKSKEQEDWEERHTMYLSKPAPEMEPWYAQRDLQSGKSRRRSEDQVLEETFKDTELKRTHDPLAGMEWFLKKRQERQAEKSSVRRSRYEETPRREEKEHGPPLLKARQKRGTVPEWKRRAQEEAERDEYAPSRPPPPPPSRPPSASTSSRDTPESAAQSRELSERARALALKAEAKRKKAEASARSSSVVSTPMSEIGYHDGYNKEVTRGLHERQRSGRGEGWKSRRWD